MQIKRRIGAAALGLAAMGLIFSSGGCSAAETPANTAAAQPVNAQTPTIEELMESRKRERAAAEAANKAPASTNGIMTSADVQKLMPKVTPFQAPALDMKRDFKLTPEMIQKQQQAHRERFGKNY